MEELIGVIRHIDNEIGKEFLRINHASDEGVFIRDYPYWLGYYDGDELIGSIALHPDKCGNVVLSALFTRADHRRMGVCNSLVDYLIGKIKNHSTYHTLICYATHRSFRHFEKRGFYAVQKYRNGTIKMIRRLKNDNINL